MVIRPGQLSPRRAASCVASMPPSDQPANQLSGGTRASSSSSHAPDCGCVGSNAISTCNRGSRSRSSSARVPAPPGRTPSRVEESVDHASPHSSGNRAQHSASASSRRSSCASLWLAVRVIRSRALPAGTVGGRMAPTRMPRSRSKADNSAPAHCCPPAPAGSASGWPSASADLRRAGAKARDQSVQLVSAPASLRSSSRLFSVAQATAGGWLVV